MKKGVILLSFIFLHASYLIQNFDKNCNRGNSISCALLGLIYFNGQNVKKDIKKAVLYYKKACFLKEKIPVLNFTNIIKIKILICLNFF
jgi:TPR repeat protein